MRKEDESIVPVVEDEEFVQIEDNMQEVNEQIDKIEPKWSP